MPVDSASESRLAAAQAGLAAARTIKAAGPASEPDSLRAAYLDLLKLSLCDLVGSTSVGVGRTEDGLVMARTMTGDELKLRSAGMDWPANGLTMVGLRRLDDLQTCVAAIVRDDVDGDLIEAGTWRGGASLLMRATLDTLGDRERTVCVADSFQGFPAGASVGDGGDLGVFGFLSVPVDEVRANFSRLGLDHGVEFLPGFFEETLPGLVGRRWSLIRLDGDTYESTQLALRCLYPGLVAGGYLVVDDYGALEVCEAAVDDFRREYGITEPLEQVDWTCVRWRRLQERPLDVRPPAARPVQPYLRPVSERVHTPVPTIEELDLRGQLDLVRQQLADTTEQLEALRAAQMRTWRARIGRLVRRVIR